MSYKKIVLRDDPVAYWPMAGLSSQKTYANMLQEYTKYQQWIDMQLSYSQDSSAFTIEDVSEYGNHAGFTLGIPVFQNILPLSTKSSTDSQIAACEINDSSSIEIPNLDNAYKIFYKGTEEVKFGIEFWILFPNQINTKNSIIKIENENKNIIAEIYALDDSIYFNLNGIDAVSGSLLSYTTKKQISSYDKKIHVFAMYNEKNIEIFVNGISQESINMSSRFEFTESNYNKIFYYIGPAPSNNSYIISDLAFYYNKLSSNQINNHIVWGNRDSSPELYVKQGEAYHFDIKNQDYMYSIKKDFVIKSDYDKGSYAGLYFDGTGLTIPVTQFSQEYYGSWYYNLPISAYENFKGIDISWDSGSQNIHVLSSYDNGLTFNNFVENNKLVSNFLTTATSMNSSNLLLKVQIYSPDSSLPIQPRLDNLSIKIYKDLTIISDAGGFSIAPLSGKTYNISKEQNKIISNPENLGLYFTSQDNGTTYPGTAKISSANSSTYQSLEFWLKYNDAGEAIVSSSTNSNSSLYLVENNGIKTFYVGSGIDHLYINGIEYHNSDNFQAVSGRTYHIVLAFATQQTDEILLNGCLVTGVNPSSCSIGHISLHQVELSQADAMNRYLSYLTLFVGSVPDDGTTIIGSLAEYSDESTKLNGGIAVISRPHTY